MSPRPAYRLCAVLAALVVAVFPTAADDIGDFNAAVERAAAHNRVALGYLRTESIDLAVVELSRMKVAWGDLNIRFSAGPPAAFRDNQLYTETMIDVPMRIVTANLMLDMGRPDMARASLQAIRVSLSKLRRTSGIEILADCVLDYSAALAPLIAFDDTPPDWTRPDMASELSAGADAIAKVTRHCDGLADEKVRTQPEFRRLMDGTLASLDFVPQVIAARDNDLLHRLIGELRAFDNLLAFRFG